MYIINNYWLLLLFRKIKYSIHFTPNVTCNRFAYCVVQRNNRKAHYTSAHRETQNQANPYFETSRLNQIIELTIPHILLIILADPQVLAPSSMMPLCSSLSVSEPMPAIYSSEASSEILFMKYSIIDKRTAVKR